MKTVHFHLYRILFVASLVMGISTTAMAQSSATAPDTTAPDTGAPSTSAPSMIDPGTIIGPNFLQPARAPNPAFNRSLGACIAVFRREVQLYHFDHPPDLTPSHDTLLHDERLYAPYPASAITAGRNCYRAIYPTPNDVATEDLTTLWPLAVATNDDAFARALSARWLQHLGTNTYQNAAADAQAAWLEHNVKGLVGTAGWDGQMHLTDAHVTMARQYLTQLEAIGSSQIVHWMDARIIFDQAISENLALATDTAVQAAINDAQHVISVLQATPLGALSSANRQRLMQLEENMRVYGVARLTYLKTLAHADLTRFAQLVDSTWGGKRPWLVGRPAPALTADYWFGTPSGTSPLVLPATNTVSLIVFISPQPGEPATSRATTDAMLRRLHAKYPALQIILMTVTKGYWGNESLLGHPEREAELVYHYVHDSLKVPGIVGVLKGKQRVVTSDGKTVPVQLPLLDKYMVDVSFLRGLLFVVDRQGWVVDQGMSVVPLISRLSRRSEALNTAHASTP